MPRKIKVINSQMEDVGRKKQHPPDMPAVKGKMPPITSAQPMPVNPPPFKKGQY